jgi:hypothetical protein
LIRTCCEGQQTRLAEEEMPLALITKYDLSGLAHHEQVELLRRKHSTGCTADGNVSADSCSEVRWQSRNPSPSQARKKEDVE